MASNLPFVTRSAWVALFLLGTRLLLAADETSAPGKAQPALLRGEDPAQPEEIAPAKNADISKVPAPAQVEIESKFIETTKTAILRLTARGEGVELLRAALRGGSDEAILSHDGTSELLTALSSAGGVDFLSAPRVITRSGQRAVIEIIREVRYPSAWERDAEKQLWLPTAFETRNCGLTLEIDPLVAEDGAITLKLVPQLVEFLGFRDFDSGKTLPSRTRRLGLTQRNLAFTMPPRTSSVANHRLQPVFSARKCETTVTLRQGEALLLTSLPETEEVHAFRSPAKSRRLIATVSARVIDSVSKSAPPALDSKLPTKTESPVSSSAATAPTASLTSKLAATFLRALVRPGDEPGFVRSPHAPGSGVIDVRGFPPGTEVKCPYSAKVFLVP